MANLQVDDLPLIPDANNADLYAAKSNLDYRVRSGEANGIATLDGAGKVPASQLPTLNFLPLSGGTLTGNLNGTTATFSGLVRGATFQADGSIFSSGTNTVILSPNSPGAALIRPNGAGNTTAQLNLTSSFMQYDSNVGIGTDPTFAPGIGNPVLGANNVIQYNAGNIAHRVLSDSAGVRTHEFTFGAAGIGIADAGLRWTTSTRVLDFLAGGAVRASLDPAGHYSAARITSTARVTSSSEGYFAGPTTHVVLGPTGTGQVGATLYLRPRGVDDGTGATTISGSNGTMNVNGRVTNDAGYYQSNTAFVVLSTVGGNVYLRPNGPDNAAGQLLLDTSGNATAVNFIATSDLTLKNVIGTVAPRDFSTLDIIDWTWKDNGEYGIGVGAQNVKAIAKEYVHENHEGTLSVDKGGLALEWAASLEKKIKMLEARLRDLEEKLK